MAVPKKKTSVSRKGKRHAGQHHKLYAKNPMNCPNCGEATLPLHVCPACGVYKGREVIKFKEVSEETDTTENELGFKLKEVNFNNVLLDYENKKLSNKAIVKLNKTSFSGDFNSDSSILRINSDLYIEEISSDRNVYFSKKPSKVEIGKSKFTANKIWLDKGKISIGEMTLDVSSVFDLKKKTSKINAIAENVTISDVFSLMPNEVSKELKSYKTDGKVNGEIEILTKKNQDIPTISSAFNIVNGTVTESSSGAKLSNLTLDGTYELSPWKQRLELTKGSGNLEGGLFSITGKMIGKNIQTIFSSVQGDLELSNLQKFINVDAIKEMTGQVKLNNQFRGTLKNEKLTVSEFNGTANLTNASVKLKNADDSYSGFSGSVTFNRFNSNATFNGKYGNSDLSINTQFSNFIPYLFNNQQLKANFYLQSKLLELDKLLGVDKEETESGEDTTGIKLPERILATIRTNIEKLTYEKHSLSNLSGNISLNQNRISSNNLKFNANNGNYNVTGSIKKNGSGFILNSNMVCGQIDISNFLERFDNFGQTTLRNDHLSGNANAIISMQANLTKHLEIDLNTLSAKTEFSISNGVLRNLELFDEIGEYLKSNAISRSIVKVDELSKKLKTVKFSEFSNTVNISNRKISIPSMFIKTSAMDIGLHGSQTFDYDINYGISIRLTDIMTKKKDTEYGYIIDDGSGARLFLLVTGTVDEPEFKLDKTGRKEFNQQKRLEEKNNVKGILKDEFGLFKKDSSAKKTTTNPEAKPKFEIDWEEDKKEPEKKEENPQKEEKKKKRNKWLEKIKGKEEEKKNEVGFEIE